MTEGEKFAKSNGMAFLLTRPEGMKRVFFGVLCVWFAILVFWVNHGMVSLQAQSPKNAPFGIFTVPNGGTYAQDFSYNMLYFQGIRERQIEHPYRMADQEKFMRHLLPEYPTGMTHAYSPVAFVLAQPLLWFSGPERYLLYTVLCAAGLVLLYQFVLLPRAETLSQLGVLAIAATSVCLILAFRLGQSSLLTTSLLGAFWALLRNRGNKSPLKVDLPLALLFWALCLKPSVAIIPAMLLLGAQAWRPLALGGAFLLVTWSCVAGFYGGWWTGLGDYSHLLNHYNGSEMTSFMQRPYDSPGRSYLAVLIDRFSTQLFSLERGLILAASALLLLLRWTRRLNGSEHFQGMIGAFLLVSPYLLPSEDLILCLLAAEGPFFRTGEPLARWAKILVLLGILDWRGGVTFPVDLNYPLRAALFGWMLLEAMRARGKSVAEPAGDFKSSAAPT
jgi:hypothetical protein